MRKSTITQCGHAPVALASGSPFHLPTLPPSNDLKDALESGQEVDVDAFIQKSTELLQYRQRLQEFMDEHNSEHAFFDATTWARIEMARNWGSDFSLLDQRYLNDLAKLYTEVDRSSKLLPEQKEKVKSQLKLIEFEFRERLQMVP